MWVENLSGHVVNICDLYGSGYDYDQLAGTNSCLQVNTLSVRYVFDGQ